MSLLDSPKPVPVVGARRVRFEGGSQGPGKHMSEAERRLRNLESKLARVYGRKRK